MLTALLRVQPERRILLTGLFIFLSLCQRGNVIRYNHIHETLRFMPGADVRGIMLDDEYASVVIEHNVFYNVSSPSCFLTRSVPPW